MLKSLTAKNFQSWEKVRFEFSKGVNCIIGSSTKGKTSIKRALEKLTFNNPSGCRFYSNFADKKGSTEISLETNKNSISLTIPITETKKGERKSKPPVYRLNKNPFQPGTIVPDKVIEALNLNELNFQGQLDNPFLVTSSGGKIAKAINKITKLEDVDSWQSELTTKINEQNNKIKFDKSELSDKKEELRKFKGIADIDVKLKELSTLNNKIIKNESILKDIEKILYDLSIVDNDIEKLKDIDKIDLKINELKEIENKLKDNSELNTTLSEYIDVNNSLDNLKDTLGPITKKIEELNDIIISLEDTDRLLFGLESYIEYHDEIEELNDEIEELKPKITTELKKQKTCSYCLSEIDDKKIKRIIKKVF